MDQAAFAEYYQRTPGLVTADGVVAMMTD